MLPLHYSMMGWTLEFESSLGVPQTPVLTINTKPTPKPIKTIGKGLNLIYQYLTSVNK